jgi:hypothetical protein
MRTKIVWTMLLLALLGTTALHAVNRYVRAGATGARNGSDWTNAWASLPATLVRGDTYYVADGTYPSLTLDDPESGAQYITIKKATAADHGTSTGWLSSYGDGQAVFSGWSQITRDYYIIDGQGRSGWKSGYGFKITAPSSSQTVRLDDTSGAGTSAAGSHYLTFRYIEFDGASYQTGDAIYSLGQNSNIKIQYCYFRDYSRTHILSRSWDTVLVEYTHFSRNKSSAAVHGESWSDMSSDNVIVRYNYWEDCEGTAVIFTRTGPNSQVTSNWQVYGNVAWWSSSYSEEGVSAFIQFSSRMQGTKVYNNTIYNGPGVYQGIRVFSDGLSVDVQVFNNIWWNCRNAYHGGTVGSGLVADYNFYYNSPHTAEAHQQVWTGSSIFVNPAAGDFGLLQPTQAGSVLPAPYNVDLNGTTRGADGLWDRGAHEYRQTIATKPAPPRNLRVSR